MSPSRTTLAISLALVTCASGWSRVQDPEQGGGAGDQQEPAPYADNQCVQCHAGLEGILGQAVEDWRHSTHAEQSTGCDGCHGGDAADPDFQHGPDTGFVDSPRLHDVPYFCGKCHADIKEKHLGSPHGAQGLPNCVTCHGSHEIVEPVPERIITEEACTKCHGFEPAEKAVEALNKARGLLADLEELTAELEHIPAIGAELDRLQEELKLDRHGIVSTFHSFRIGEIERIGMNVDRVKKISTRLLEREMERRESMAREIPFVLGLMLFLVFAAILGFFVYHGKGSVEPGK